jgi:hypothetical protein
MQWLSNKYIMNPCSTFSYMIVETCDIHKASLQNSRATNGQKNGKATVMLKSMKAAIFVYYLPWNMIMMFQNPNQF